MSSFNTYDNYNSFNDLINRTELLEEKTYKAMVKGANLGPELKKFRSEDGKGLSATSRVKNLILISALVQMDLLDDDVAATLKRKATSSSYITNTLKDLAPKVHAQLFDGDNPGSEEVVKYVQDNIDQLLPFAVKNVTRGEYEKAEVDTEVPDDAEAKELEDEVSAEVRLAKGLMDGEAEKVELDFDEADIFIDGIDAGVKNAVSQQAADYLNKQGIKAGLKAEVTRAGVNIEAPTGFFGDAARMAQFEDKLKGLVMDMDGNIPEERIRVKFTGSDGPVEYKDEDYEEGPEPMEPEGPANEYEEGINEVEDEDNEFDDFDIGPQSDENVPNDYEEVLAALVDDDKKKHAMKQLNGEDEEGGRQEYEKALQTFNNDMHGYMGYAGDRWTPSGPVDEKGQPKKPNPADYGLSESEEDEERIVMQPMLETRKTDTSVYLTEQSASDKRNKKTEVKNQSFKERYKPKTHWQLEELRRYGL